MGLDKINDANLAHYYCTEHYFKSLVPKVCYTDGAKFLKDNGAAWLIDDIAAFQLSPRIKNNPELQDFQLWILKVKDGKGVLTCQVDTGRKHVVKNEYMTDFPLSELKLYCNSGYTEVDGPIKVIMLASEY